MIGFCCQIWYLGYWEQVCTRSIHDGACADVLFVSSHLKEVSFVF